MCQKKSDGGRRCIPHLIDTVSKDVGARWRSVKTLVDRGASDADIATAVAALNAAITTTDVQMRPHLHALAATLPFPRPSPTVMAARRMAHNGLADAVTNRRVQRATNISDTDIADLRAHLQTLRATQTGHDANSDHIRSWVNANLDSHAKRFTESNAARTPTPASGCRVCGERIEASSQTNLCWEHYLDQLTAEGLAEGLTREEARYRAEADADMAAYDYDHRDLDFDAHLDIAEFSESGMNDPYPTTEFHHDDLTPAFRPAPYTPRPRTPGPADIAASTGKPVIAAWSPNGTSGDGYIYFPDGTRRWGVYGAAGIAMRHIDPDGTERFFLAKRGAELSGGANTWAFPGGAIDKGETPITGSLREFQEEINVDVPEVHIHHEHRVTEHDTWSYTTVVATVPTLFVPPTTMDWESSDAGWFTREEIAAMPLHPGVEKSLADIYTGYTRPVQHSESVTAKHRAFPPPATRAEAAVAYKTNQRPLPPAPPAPHGPKAWLRTLWGAK